MYRIIGYRHPQDYLECRECRWCNAIIEYKTKYVKTKVERYRYTEYIICPNCGEKIQVLISEFNPDGNCTYKE